MTLSPAVTTPRWVPPGPNERNDPFILPVRPRNLVRRKAHLKYSAGQVLGRYELLVPIAKGGMAQVWAARLRGSRGFQKIVAIKIIRAGTSDDARME